MFTILDTGYLFFLSDFRSVSDSLPDSRPRIWSDPQSTYAYLTRLFTCFDEYPLGPTSTYTSAQQIALPTY